MALKYLQIFLILLVTASVQARNEKQAKILVFYPIPGVPVLTQPSSSGLKPESKASFDDWYSSWYFSRPKPPTQKPTYNFGSYDDYDFGSYNDHDIGDELYDDEIIGYEETDPMKQHKYHLQHLYMQKLRRHLISDYPDYS